MSARATRSLLVTYLSLIHTALEGWRPAAPTEPAKVSQTRMLVQRRLADPELSVASLAAELQCTPDHLSFLFRRFSRTTLVAYINEQRLARACHLLTVSSLNIAEVSAASGFCTPSYFTRLFSKQKGLTPLAYRRRNLAA